MTTDHQVSRICGTALTALAMLALSACGTSDNDTGAASQTPSGQGGSASISVPTSALLAPGKLTVCSDLTSPPIEFYTEDNKPTGSDVELGNAMAQKMGLTGEWANTSFNGIIPALQAQRCDVIMSQLYIKPEREAVVDFVPYMYSGSTFIVKKSGGIQYTGAEDLCGKKAAAETGTTVVDFLQKHSADCKTSGKKPIDIRQFTKDADALQQLKIGLVDAYGTTVETAAYDIKQSNGDFMMVGEPFNRIKVGAATRKDNAALHDALTKALAAVHEDGQYDKIMSKWGLDADSLAAGS